LRWASLTERLAIVLVAVALLPVIAPCAAQGLAFGLADQNAETFADARVGALDLSEARLVVPYDAALTDPLSVARWLTAVRAAGLRPQIAFSRRRGDDCPRSPCMLPTRAEYATAVRAFVRRFPSVRRYTTWNEANHRAQPTAEHPAAVAGYYRALKAACPRCAVVAGDVLDAGNYRGWLAAFLRASPRAPRLWGLHDYGDVTYDRTTGIRTILATVGGHVWITESGGIVAIRDAEGRSLLAVGERDAARAVTRAFSIARAYPRVTLLDIYQWRAAPLDRFDSGLVRPDGSSRLSYFAALRARRAADVLRLEAKKVMDFGHVDITTWQKAAQDALSRRRPVRHINCCSYGCSAAASGHTGRGPVARIGDLLRAATRETASVPMPAAGKFPSQA
jgi:hypothetical protein